MGTEGRGRRARCADSVQRAYSVPRPVGVPQAPGVGWKYSLACNNSMIASLSHSDSIIISQLFAEAMRAAEGLGAAGARTVVGVWACASNTEGGAARAWISARGGAGAASTGMDGAVVPWLVERVGAGPSTAVRARARDETGAGAELPHLALSTSGSAFHRWPRTLSLSALRKDVGSNGRCARQNSLSDRARSVTRSDTGSAGNQPVCRAVGPKFEGRSVTRV